MNKNILLLVPVYNDWSSLTKLLRKVNRVFEKELKTKFELIIVNDCSSGAYDFKKYKLKTIKKIKVITLNENVGSQRAIAIGLRYINKFYKKKFNTIIMDSDGQDNPYIIKKLILKSNLNPGCSIVVDRGQRKEPLWFRFFYEAYCLLVKIFSSKKIRFGNYSLISFSHLKKLSSKDELWSAFPPTVCLHIKNLIHIKADREKRYTGESKMNFFGLIFHALKIFSVLKYKVLIFSLIYFFLSLVLFYETDSLYFFLINFLLFFLNLFIFSISINNKKKFLENFKKIKIKII